MLNLKKLLAAALLSGLALVSFAQTPHAAKSAKTHAAVTAHKHAGHAAKPKLVKSKAHGKKHKSAKHHVNKQHKATAVHKAKAKGTGLK
jgi:hypothetical protein